MLGAIHSIPTSRVMPKILLLSGGEGHEKTRHTCRLRRSGPWAGSQQVQVAISSTSKNLTGRSVLHIQQYPHVLPCVHFIFGSFSSFVPYEAFFNGHPVHSI